MYKMLCLLIPFITNIAYGLENQQELPNAWINSSDIYKNGFLYSTRDRIIIPPHYKRVSSHLWIDHRLEIQQTNNVCLIGTVIDSRNANTDLSKIVDDLDQALALSEQKFHEEGDYLCGRYIILYKTSDGKTKIVSDAVGQRTIYHVADGSIVASHAKLLADNLQEGNVEIPINRFKRQGTYPGKSTPYEGVLALTPNTTLELKTGVIQRFYPYGPLLTLPAEKAASDISLLGTNILKGLEKISKKQNKLLLVSFTAGVDSRTTLALTKTALKAIPQTFTYKWIQRDFDLTPEICSKLKIPHINIEFTQTDESNFKNTYNIISTNSYWSICTDPYKGLGVSLVNPVTLDAFQNRYIHIRSSIYEIGRAFFYKCSKSKIKLSNFSENALYNMFLMNNGLGPWSEEDLSFVKEALKHYCESTQLNPSTLFNFDIRDIYYWEQRVGTWLAQMTLEDDVLFDTIMIYNCRAILSKSLQVPFNDRVNGMVQKLIIKYNWKELCNWDINGKYFWHDYFKVKKKLKTKNKH